MEIIESVKNIIAVIVAVFTLLFTIIKLHQSKKQVKMLEAELKQNKENQKNSEGENMAKFLCDKCGASIEVKEAENVHGYDLCHTCAEQLRANMAREKELAEQVELAKNCLTSALEELSATVLHGNKVLDVNSVLNLINAYNAKIEDTNANKSVLDALGIK